MSKWTPVDYNPQARACGVGLYLGFCPISLLDRPPPAAAVCPGRVIPALGATGLVPYTPLSLNFSLHIRGLGHATLEPPDLHAKSTAQKGAVHISRVFTNTMPLLRLACVRAFFDVLAPTIDIMHQY